MRTPHRLNTYQPRDLTSAVHIAMGSGEVADWLIAYIEANFDPKPSSEDFDSMEEAYLNGYVAADNGHDPGWRRPRLRDVIRPEDDPHQLTLF